MLTLPLWIITEHINPTDQLEPPKCEPGSLVAFNSNEKLFAFKVANRGGEWKMQLADDRDGLLILIADLHRLAITSFALNPEKDGSGGEQIELTDLVAYADSLKP